MLDHEFRQAIESVKLRAPIEEIVRERVPELKRSGALWVACCPFHEERTPSFKVDPRRATWHCFGACSTGGDVISFVERFDNTSFMDSLELLAERTGVRLPEKRRPGRDGDESRSVYEVLDRACTFYTQKLHTPQGERGLAYLRERGFTDEVLELFGLGWAPQQGSPLAAAARSGSASLADLERAGLCRTGDDGRSYDFFRGRVVVPIRDSRGRTVGFGGRLLPGQEGPKYVNTAETPLFRKGRIIYGFDLALEHVRRERHLILVEGYMDVMGAHQVGVRNVAAVLGTATTDDHAMLVRRSGAKRVTLVFDGDDAGRLATMRALAGLLPTELEIDVATPPPGTDPCDLCMRGEDAFRAFLTEEPKSWFEWVLEGLAGLEPAALAAGADEVFELLLRLPKPVHREALLDRMAGALSVSRASLLEQYDHLRARKSARRAPVREPEPEPAEAAPTPAVVLPGVVLQALRDLIGAVLVDNSLMPLAEPHFERAVAIEGAEGELEYLRAVMSALLELFADPDDVRAVDVGRALDALGDHPARDLVVPLEEHVRRATSATDVAQGALRLFEERERKRRIASKKQTLSGTLEDDRQELRRLHAELVKGHEG